MNDSILTSGPGRAVAAMLVVLLTGCGTDTQPAASSVPASQAAVEAPVTEMDNGNMGQKEMSETPMAAANSGDGGTIFKKKGICFTCHGAEGKGTALGPNLTDAEWINIEPPVNQASVADLIKKGVPKPVKHPAPMMPRAGTGLTDAEVDAVAAYVMTLQGS